MNGSESILEQLSPETSRLLRQVADVACKRGKSAYLVGGAVRDLFLAKASLDLDVVVEGRAISLAAQLATAGNVPIKKHPRFGTANLSLGDVNIDLVTARSETYSRPGALPQVTQGTIAQDLARRDFSINAMALRLDLENFGQLLDPHGGREDIKKGIIRVLHRDSFSDDPTRILRALRYEQRLDFQLDAETETLLKQGLRKLDTVSPERRWHEMELVLAEAQPEKVLGRAARLGVLEKLCPSLDFDDRLSGKFIRARDEVDETFSLQGVYLALLSYGLGGEDVEGCISRLKVPGRAARIMRDAVRLSEKVPLLAPLDISASGIFRILQGYGPEAVKAAAVAIDPPVMKERINLFLDHLRYVKPILTGDDLSRLGVPPGKPMGQMLRHLQDARLDGEVEGRSQEEIFVKALLASQ